MAAVQKDLYLKIGRPQNTCVACGATIAHAGKHPSVLRTPAEPVLGAAGGTEQEGPRREDYCADCWKELAERDFVGFWLAKREPPKPRKIETRKERNAAVLAWFEHLQRQEPDAEVLQSLYFLAHLLMKYGVLKWQRTDKTTDDDEVVVFRATGTEDDVFVASVELTDERIVEIKRDLDEYLLQYANNKPEADEPVGAEADADAEDGETDGGDK